MSNSGILIKPENVHITVRRAVDNRAIRHLEVKNRFVKSGRNQLRDLFNYPALPSPGIILLNPDGFTPDFCGVGTDATAVADTNEQLGAQVARAQITQRLPLDSGSKIIFYLDPGQGNGFTLREVGLFSLLTGGLLWARAVHPAISKSISISVTYEWTFTISVP